MKRVSLEDYVRSPVGCFTVSPGFVHFCAEEPRLAGAVSLGAFAPHEEKDILRCSLAAATHLPEHVALADGRRAVSWDAVAFKTATTFILQHRHLLREKVQRFALVRPADLVGAATEGFFRVVTPPYPVQVFDARTDALRWLGGEQHAAWLDELERELDAASQKEGRDLVEALKRCLDETCTTATLSDTARRLAVSVRSLQRRLHERGTSYQRELRMARLRAAQRMMLESDAPLIRIATAAGFASAASFSAVFRRHQRESPSSWRASAARA